MPDLVTCILLDLEQPPHENNKQQRNNKIIGVNDVPSPDLCVASYATCSKGGDVLSYPTYSVK